MSSKMKTLADENYRLLALLEQLNGTISGTILSMGRPPYGRNSEEINASAQMALHRMYRILHNEEYDIAIDLEEFQKKKEKRRRQEQKESDPA